jgi:hypothetical protein
MPLDVETVSVSGQRRAGIRTSGQLPIIDSNAHRRGECFALIMLCSDHHIADVSRKHLPPRHVNLSVPAQGNRRTGPRTSAKSEPDIRADRKHVATNQHQLSVPLHVILLFTRKRGYRLVRASIREASQRLAREDGESPNHRQEVQAIEHVLVRPRRKFHPRSRLLRSQSATRSLLGGPPCCLTSALMWRTRSRLYECGSRNQQRALVILEAPQDGLLMQLGNLVGLLFYFQLANDHRFLVQDGAEQVGNTLTEIVGAP